MSCYITSGVALGCSDGIGGIKQIYVLGTTGATASVTGVTYSGASVSAPITGLTGEGTWYSFELKRNTSSLSQNTTKNFENGTIYWEQVLTAVLFKYDQAKRDILLEMGLNDKMQVIAIDQNDTQYYLGQVNGMYLSGGSAATGTAFGDRNGFELILTGQEAKPASVISGTLSSIFSAGGFTVA
jgi:hypothetical protein